MDSQIVADFCCRADLIESDLICILDSVSKEKFDLQNVMRSLVFSHARIFISDLLNH